MRLPSASAKQFDIGSAIDTQVQGDYIYHYPPRQAYRPLPTNTLAHLIDTSLDRTINDPVNLYLHFPFCRQICGFCNLYAVTGSNEALVGAYLAAMRMEIDWWAEKLIGRRIDTIYLGGGTPSSLAPSQLEAILGHLESRLQFSRSEVPEISLEVAPDTVDKTRLQELASIGVNRVNLGLQTTSDDGLRNIGRKHTYGLAKQSIKDALASGFRNVCVDLIYGLPGQTMDHWEESVDEVINLKPDTICAYPLTLRPYTGFNRQNAERAEGAIQYHKYKVAEAAITRAGYEQETHVRYITPESGGYRQKSNHWACQDIIGIGAGARGYLEGVDYRNRYSVRHRRRALTDYIDDITSGRWAYNAGFHLTDSEKARRAIVLGLLKLDRKAFELRFGADPITMFPKEFGQLGTLDLIEVSSDSIIATKRGRQYRDLMVLKFFSDEVWRAVEQFGYDE